MTSRKIIKSNFFFVVHKLVSILSSIFFHVIIINTDKFRSTYNTFNQGQSINDVSSLSSDLEVYWTLIYRKRKNIDVIAYNRALLMCVYFYSNNNVHVKLGRECWMEVVMIVQKKPIKQIKNSKWCWK